jgi:hypothetical protein
MNHFMADSKGAGLFLPGSGIAPAAPVSVIQAVTWNENRKGINKRLSRKKPNEKAPFSVYCTSETSTSTIFSIAGTGINSFRPWKL